MQVDVHKEMCQYDNLFCMLALNEAGIVFEF